MLIDHTSYSYCEDFPDLLISQPVNTLSNIIFWIVAIWIYNNKNKAIINVKAVYILTAAAFFVGLDSAIWHLTSLGWALYLDITSISIYSAISMFLVFRHVIKFSTAKSIQKLVIVLIACALCKDLYPDIFTLNTGAFVPIALALFILGAYSGVKEFYLAGLSIAAAIFFRIYDLESCSYIPIGTHFLWHLFSGLGLWLFTKTLFQKK